MDPQIEYKSGVGKDGEETTTVTIVDILPKHTEYIDGSTYFGGEYQQTSPIGGKQGNIINGLEGGKEEKKNDNQWSFTKNIVNGNSPITVTQERKRVGTQWVLTWTFENMPIKRPMEPIYYSVKIQNSVLDESQASVPLENEVYITSTDDKRPHSMENGNFAVEEVKAEHAKQDSHGKTVSQSWKKLGKSIIPFIITISLQMRSKTCCSWIQCQRMM